MCEVVERDFGGCGRVDATQVHLQFSVDVHPNVVIPAEVKDFPSFVLERGDDLRREMEIFVVHDVIFAANPCQREEFIPV